MDIRPGKDWEGLKIEGEVCSVVKQRSNKQIHLFECQTVVSDIT